MPYDQGVLHLRHPELASVCDLVGLPLDVSTPESHRAAFLFDAQGRCDVTAIYVCVEEDTLGLSWALGLHIASGSTAFPSSCV